MQERKEKEALAADGGWTVVVHHKGRKKTTDSETGIAVGSVAQAAVENKMAKKKRKEVGLDFYRFQKREAQRNGIISFFFEIDLNVDYGAFYQSLIKLFQKLVSFAFLLFLMNTLMCKKRKP